MHHGQSNTATPCLFLSAHEDTDPPFYTCVHVLHFVLILQIRSISKTCATIMTHSEFWESSSIHLSHICVKKSGFLCLKTCHLLETARLHRIPFDKCVPDVFPIFFSGRTRSDRSSLQLWTRCEHDDVDLKIAPRNISFRNDTRTRSHGHSKSTTSSRERERFLVSPSFLGALTQLIN